jgi:hypothetical protein
MAGLNSGLFPLLKDLAAKYGPSVGRVIDSMGVVFGKVFGFVQKEILPIVGRLVTAIGKALGPVVEKIGPLVKAWEPVFKAVFGFIRDVVVPILEKVVIPLVGKLYTAFLTVATVLGGAVSGAFKRIEPVLRTVGDILSRVIGFINDVIKKVASAPIIRDFLGFIGGGTGRSAGGYGRIAAGGARTAVAASSVVNVTVTQANPDAVVAAISRYARVNGSTPGFARAISR